MAARLPTFTIITPSFNQGAFLEETIFSVLNQQGLEVEYIVIDGGSADDSVRIIERHSSRIAYWVSEPDKGQADAINKGLRRAHGDWIGFLNSDDVYLPGGLASIAHVATHRPEVSWVCGEVVMFGAPDRAPQLLEVRPPRDAAACLFLDYQTPQPGNFWRRDLFQSYGELNDTYRYCFDHDFYVRLLLGGVTCRRVPYPVAGYRLHPSSKTVSEIDRFESEFLAIRRRYLSEVPKARARHAQQRERFRRAGVVLSEADAHRRRGEWMAAVKAIWMALNLSPFSVLFFTGRRLRKLTGFPARPPSRGSG